MDRKKEKQLAMDMKNNIMFDPADCRNIVIATGDLCKAQVGVDILEKALKLFHDMPEERITNFTKGPE